MQILFLSFVCELNAFNDWSSFEAAFRKFDEIFQNFNSDFRNPASSFDDLNEDVGGSQIKNDRNNHWNWSKFLPKNTPFIENDDRKTKSVFRDTPFFENDDGKTNSVRRGFTNFCDGCLTSNCSNKIRGGVLQNSCKFVCKENFVLKDTNLRTKTVSGNFDKITKCVPK